jgi:hypothetical protein
VAKSKPRLPARFDPAPLSSITASLVTADRCDQP